METIKKYNNYLIIGLLLVAMMTTGKAQISEFDPIMARPTTENNMPIFYSQEKMPEMAEIELKGNYGQQQNTRQSINNPLSSIQGIFSFIGTTAKKFGLLDIFVDGMYLILSVMALIFFIRIIY